MREEFMEKGFEGASIRSIGARAGMTSAGLYRHYPDKEAMFCAIVDPLIGEIRRWTQRHKTQKYELVDQNARKDELFGESFTDMILEVVLPHKEEFRLLITSSKGTKYENFVHDYVMYNQGEFMEALDYLKKKGYPVKEIDEEKIHMLLSAYITACLEPIVHDYDDGKIGEYMKTIQEFFLPGWMNIMGLS